MEITVGSYKIRLEIVILIVIVSWIMFGHLLCGCCKVRMFEGITNPTTHELQKHTKLCMQNMRFQISGFLLQKLRILIPN